MRKALCVAVALLLLAGGCEKKKQQPGAGSGSGSGSGSGEASGWAELLGVARPGAGGGGLAEVIKGFPGFETCVERLQRSLPPDLTADMLPGYDLPDALCRTREALAKDSISSCSRVVSYSMKKSCEIMYAMYRKRPELCPSEYPARMGRNGYCLAIAERSPIICGSARSDEDEARCRAVLGRDDAPCSHLTRPETRERCKAEARRWAAVMTDVKPVPAGFQAGAELTLKSSNPSRPVPFERVKLSCAEQGVVAPTSGDTSKVVLCGQIPYASYRYSRNVRYDSPEYRTKLNMEFRPPSSDTAKLTFGTADIVFQLRITGFDEFSGPQTGELQFQKFERRRGGRVKGTFKVTLEQGPDRLTVEGSFDTFVRDLVDPLTLAGSSYGYGSGYGGAYGGSGYGSGALGSLGTGGTGGSGAGGLGSRGVGSAGSGGVGALGSLRGTGTKRYAGVLTSATLIAEKQGTRVIGYRVRSIQPASIWEKLGVKEEDVVTQLGSTKLQRTDDLVHIRTELRDAKRLLIKIKRGKKPQVLNLGPAQLQKIRDEFEL